MEMGRSIWLTVLIPAIMVSSLYGEAAATDGETATAGGPPPETNVLCVSKCGTCPTVCSSPSPPPPSSPNSDGSGYSSPSPPRSTTPPSPPAGQQSQAKGRNPSGYYYFLTAGSGRSCAASSVRYTQLLLLAVLPFLVAV
nr:proline-rich receptor-like protein kinase PERK1 [Lolium perenne]